MHLRFQASGYHHHHRCCYSVPGSGDGLLNVAQRRHAQRKQNAQNATEWYDSGGQSSSSGRQGVKRSASSSDVAAADLEEYQRTYGALSWMGLLKVVAEQDRKLKESELRELARDQTISDLRKKTRLLQQSVRRKGKALEASKQELETCKSRKKTAADSIDNQLLDFLLSAAEGHGCGAIVFSRDLVVKGLMQIAQPVFSNKKYGSLQMI